LLLVVAFFYFDPFNEFARETNTVNVLIAGVFQPFVFSGATIIVCFLLGLPLRLHSQLWNWWTTRSILHLLLIIIGLVLLIPSNHRRLEVSGDILEK
jgi:hypothetical protein